MKQRANQWGDGRVRGDAQRFPFNHCLCRLFFFLFTFFSLSARKGRQRVVPPPIPLAVKRGEERKKKTGRQQLKKKKSFFFLLAASTATNCSRVSSTAANPFSQPFTPSTPRRRDDDAQFHFVSAFGSCTVHNHKRHGRQMDSSSRRRRRRFK